MGTFVCDAGWTSGVVYSAGYMLAAFLEEIMNDNKYCFTNIAIQKTNLC